MNRITAALLAASSLTLAAPAAQAADLLTCTGTEVDITDDLIASDPDDGFLVVALPGSIAALPSVLPLGAVAVVYVDGGVGFSPLAPPRETSVFPPTGELLSYFAPFHADIDLSAPLVGTNPGSVTVCNETDRWFVTWSDVVAGDADATGADLSRTNSFQIVFDRIEICIGTPHFGVEFRYESLDWETAASNGGVDGVCPEPFVSESCTPATAGQWSGAVTDELVLVDGSMEPGIADTLLGGSNTGEAGVWRWNLNALVATVACGDGDIDACAGETCDDGGASTGCDVDCTAPECGDGLLNVAAGESCEDGNTDDFDGCSSTCNSEPCAETALEVFAEPFLLNTCELSDVDDLPITCDGEPSTTFAAVQSYTFTAPGTGTYVFSTEASFQDDLRVQTIIYTRAACFDDTIVACSMPDPEFGQAPRTTELEVELDAGETIVVYIAGEEEICGDVFVGVLGMFCGDMVVQAGEECDDGGESSSCNANCTLSVCGDGIRNAADFEVCDEGGDTTTCDGDCTEVRCGDEYINPVIEDCESFGSNLSDCDSDCTFPECGDGLLNTAAGEACDDGGETASCDADCTLSECGDGVVNATAGEECDDAGESSTCDDDCTFVACGDGVTNATAGETCDASGESASCDTDCSLAECGDGTVNATALESCDDGGESATCDDDCTDVECGDGVLNATAGEFCDEGNPGPLCDDDCTAVECGDGTLNTAAGEACDDGGESTTCDADCTEARCGDEVVNATAGEECDDGNTDDGDGCAADCTLEPFCGDGNVDDGEACDDGNSDNGDGCAEDCTLEPFCGDGNVDDGEECDDGNSDNGDGCAEDCSIEPACGDGTLDDGEQCDDGNTEDGDGCAFDCTLEDVCGNGTVEDGEECDDGNTDDGDGCSAECAIEAACGDGNVDDGEECDDGNTEDGDGCAFDCTIEAMCGDGDVDADEECDDGNTEDGDGCAADCTIEAACGDETVDEGEECDDGNTEDGDGCAFDCTLEPFCGDGTVDEGETCDDGNTDDDDGCDSDCQIEAPFELAGGACNNTVAGAPRPATWLLTGMALIALLPRRKR